nr:probable calcium-binding protein CML30 isoform X2 [Arachis hypogaea]
MDVKGNNVTPDFSSYILFEASGDSEEADFDHNKMVCEISRVGSYVHHGHEDYDDDDDDDDDDDGKKKEEDVVFGTSYCDEEDEVLQEQHPTRSFVSFASNQESLDEMEKNRLFWEACLAS